MEELSSITLSRLPGLSQPQALTLVKHYGTAAAALSDASPNTTAWARALHDKTAIAVAREKAACELDFCHEHGIRVIPYSSDEYPALLKTDEIPDAPLTLFYQGTGSLNRRHVLSVVGTRQITDYGKQFCENFFPALARLLPDVLIVSGLAYGVDIHAHRAALSSGLDTVAVLAHGLDRIYPALHRHTAEEMTHHGGLLTEYLTGTVPDKRNFVSRNRIVAGIARATLVIESASHGGALITARLAMSYGREVMAVPGRIGDPYSAGCNNFIRDNRAALVTSAEDVLQLLGWQSAKEKKFREPQLFPAFSPEQERIIDALQTADSLSLDQLSVKVGIPVSSLSDLLFDLEDAEAIVRLPGNRFRQHG